MKLAVFLAESPWGDIDESALDKGLGGRETALVMLALEWARAGHEVYAFVPRSELSYLTHGSGGSVRWIPNRSTIEVVEAVQPDIFISWENVEVLKALDNFYGIRAIEMQVAHLNSDVPLDDVTDYVCVLSEWAGEFLLTQHPGFDPDRVVVLPNGVHLPRFEERAMPTDAASEWDSTYHFIYSSSPDRGLHHLLNMWPTIREQVEAYYHSSSVLHVCYGIEKFIENSRWSHREDALRALTIEEKIGQPGVAYHGKIGQDALAQLMLRCDAMLYPASTMSPTETGCISIVEALAAGCPVVTTDCDCIGPEFSEVTTQVNLPVDHTFEQRYVKAIIDTLDPEDYETQVDAGVEFATARSWKLIAQQWIDFVALGQQKITI